METIGEQLKEVAYELSLYESFYHQCKITMGENITNKEKIYMINSQIELTKRLYKNHTKK